MSFRYRSHQINEIIGAAKVVREGQSLDFKPYKIDSLTLSLDLDLKDGALINLRFIVNAGKPDLPESYHAALLLCCSMTPAFAASITSQLPGSGTTESRFPLAGTRT